VESPTQEQCEKLFERYNQTLQCSCTVLSIPYEKFLQVTSIYHQVCSSDFIQSRLYQSFLSPNEFNRSFMF
ncbi:unnamed protein product, partial [Rotaria sp. Silwood2]